MLLSDITITSDQLKAFGFVFTAGTALLGYMSKQLASITRKLSDFDTRLTVLENELGNKHKR